MFRNYDPNLRTLEKAVEYTRALNAAKLEKVNRFLFVLAKEKELFPFPHLLLLSDTIYLHVSRYLQGLL